MRTFEDCQVSKNELLRSLKRHRCLDQIIRGTYWSDGVHSTFEQGGCFIGCCIHDFAEGRESEYGLFGDLFSLPSALATLGESIFENLSDYRSEVYLNFPVELVEAIPVGADFDEIERLCLSLDQQDETPETLRRLLLDGLRQLEPNQGGHNAEA